jgi:hypothetical protein
MMKCLLLVMSLTLIPVYSQGEDSVTQAELYSRLKNLSGVWRGRSTKGWENTAKYHLIARETAILETSEFVDSPGISMASVFLLKGDQLLLTHFCEAGNHPVLKATGSEQNGKKITFEFVEGTNIPTRDTGHMDKLILEFQDADHFTSQWSWYSKGKQFWFETIHYERMTQE